MNAKSKRILVLDDEEVILSLVENILDKMGYLTVTVKDGKDAIRLYDEALRSGQPFDAVIMDLTIPGGVGGKEAITALLRIDSEVKAIVSSGYSNDPVIAYYRQYGFSGVLSKPYRAQDFTDAVNKVLEGE